MSKYTVPRETLVNAIRTAYLDKMEAAIKRAPQLEASLKGKLDEVEGDSATLSITGPVSITATKNQSVVSICTKGSFSSKVAFDTESKQIGDPIDNDPDQAKMTGIMDEAKKNSQTPEPPAPAGDEDGIGEGGEEPTVGD